MPEMSAEERQQYREALKSMTENEIRRIPEEKFNDFMNWIIADMSYMLDKKDHKLIMAMVSSEYPNWYTVFVERFD